MAESNKSQKLVGAGRTYFFDIKQTRENKPYLVITESRKVEKDKFERKAVMVFPEDAANFAKMVSKMTTKIA